MADDKNDLLYRPDLEAQRTYYSDAVIPKENTVTPQNESETPIDDTPKQIVDDYKEVTNLLPLLPAAVQPIKETIAKLAKRVEIVYPSGKIDPQPPKEIDEPNTPVPIIDIIGEDIKNKADDLKDLPALFPTDNNIKLKIIKPRSLVQIIQQDYSKDTINLQKYFLQRLQLTMQRYFQEMIVIMSECGIGNMDQLTKTFDGNAVSVSNSNLRHLKDHIIRSQIIKDQKARFFKKNHNVEQTMQHMRSWHVAEKERERYYDEKYGDSDTYLNSHGNALLRQARSTYDSNYSHAFYDMYKYLNSSVIVIDDILNMTLKEAQAKGQLLKNGINIFATSESKKAAAKAASGEDELTAADVYSSNSSTTTGTTSSQSNSSNGTKTTTDNSGQIKIIGNDLPEDGGITGKESSEDVGKIINDMGNGKQ